ncbi:hypothetical protein A9498_29085 (plasmid) [Bacillus thuringiensis serovar coreanensis]|nr:hypothetical protein A9498_29085 [Bacillus thuringiensis serovar coreanensis]
MGMASPYHFEKIVRLETNCTQPSVFLLFKEIDSFLFLYISWRVFVTYTLIEKIIIITILQHCKVDVRKIDIFIKA